MTVIIDANVMIAALIKDGIVRRTVLSVPGNWVMPEHTFAEVWKHRDVWNRNGLEDDALRTIVDAFVLDFVSVIHRENYIKNRDRAIILVSDRFDWPLVALYLCGGLDGIWTFNAKHFRLAEAAGIRILNVSDAIALTRESM